MDAHIGGIDPQTSEPVDEITDEDRLLILQLALRFLLDEEDDEETRSTD